MAGLIEYGNLPYMHDALGEYRTDPQDVQDFTVDEGNRGNRFVEQRPSVRWPAGSTFFEARNSICVSGYNREHVLKVKNQIGQLLDDPIPLESFHVKKNSDLKDGAYLVPKIILVASHCPGKKLLDEEDDEGQLDYLYDEVCNVGANVLIMYVGLPKSLYPPMRHMTYHPKLSEFLFPTQPILKSLASENCFVTVSEGSDLTIMQKNLLREWITKPITNSHPVYKTADYLSSTECSMSEAETKITYATEEHPLADKKPQRKHKKKRKVKEKSRLPFRRKDRYERHLEVVNDLVPLDENDELNNPIEMDMYHNNMGSMASDATFSI